MEIVTSKWQMLTPTWAFLDRPIRSRKRTARIQLPRTGFYNRSIIHYKSL